VRALGSEFPLALEICFAAARLVLVESNLDAVPARRLGDTIHRDPIFAGVPLSVLAVLYRGDRGRSV
jgi:hypothetical protein